MSSLPSSIKRIGSKTTEKWWRHRFLHYKSMGAFCCHGNQSFDPICPKTLCNLSPTLMMLHIKFDQHWPTGLRDIQVSSELWQNHRILEGQGKSSIASTFSKRGYKNNLSRSLTTKPSKWPVRPRRLSSAWISAQFDQSSLSICRSFWSLDTHPALSEVFDQTGWMPKLQFVTCNDLVLHPALAHLSYHCTIRNLLT